MNVIIRIVIATIKPISKMGSIGFTGTPIDATLDVFGKVQHAYTMKESVDDKITVRIVYEGRADKVLLNEKKLREIEEYYKKCADEGSNEYQIEESKRAVTKMEVILGDPDRLRDLAADFVNHYETRITEGASVLGKVMFVCSNRHIGYDLYKEIIKLRIKAGLTQKQLAEKARTSQPAIARLESGSYKNVSMAFLRKIGEALGAVPVLKFKKVTA